MTTLRESHDLCQQISLQAGSSFYYSFCLLPKPQYRAMCALYAFMRKTDDLSDDPLPVKDLSDVETQIAAKRDALNRWQSLFQQSILERKPEPGIWPAVLETVENYHLEPEWLNATIEAAIEDLTPRTFETWDDLDEYCLQVAGVVGLCCIQIWGNKDPHGHDLAVVNGQAFQLTNIIRDLLVDARMERNYIPQEEWDKHNLYWNTLRDAEDGDNQFAPLIESLIERNQKLYRESIQLIDLLPYPGKMVFAAMRATYEKQLELVAQTRGRLNAIPPRVTRRTKIWYLVRAFLQRLIGKRFPAGTTTNPAAVRS